MEIRGPPQPRLQRSPVARHGKPAAIGSQKESPTTQSPFSRTDWVSRPRVPVGVLSVEFLRMADYLLSGPLFVHRWPVEKNASLTRPTLLLIILAGSNMVHNPLLPFRAPNPVSVRLMILRPLAEIPVPIAFAPPYRQLKAFQTAASLEHSSHNNHHHTSQL